MKMLPLESPSSRRKPGPGRSSRWVPAFAGMTVLLSAQAQAADLPKTRTPIAAPDNTDASLDARAIIALIDRLSTAIAAKDTATLTALTLPNGVVVSIRDDTGALSAKSFADWTAALPAVPGRLEERIGRPDITLAGGAASAAAPYIFLIDGKLHHCGTDFFQFVRTPTGWKLTAITYNSTTEGCAG